MSVFGVDHHASADAAATRDVALSFVRPGREALHWLTGMVRQLKAADPLAPVTVLVPNQYAGVAARRHLARSGGYVNVRMMRLTEVAARLLPLGRLASRAPLSMVIEESLIREAVRRQAASFGGVDHQALVQALRDLFRELRRQEVDPATVDATTLSAVTRAALAVYGELRARMAAYDDPTSIVDAATAHLTTASTVPPALARFGALVLYLPTRFDPAYARFLAAAARWVPIRAGFLSLEDPRGLADALAEADAALLARELGVPVPPLPERPPSLQLRADVTVIRAPDPSEEVREVVRQVAADLASESPFVPLYRVAILYRQVDPYAAIVRDALNAAGFPWSALEGRRLDESRPGRVLLALLQLPERQYAPSAVMEWLETGPLLPILDEIPVGEWNRIARAAGILRGAAQWTDRLRAFIYNREAERQRLEREGASDARIDAIGREIDRSARIAAFVAELARALRPPADGSPWRSFVDWVESLWDALVGPVEAWPDEVRPYAEDVRNAIARLREADLAGADHGVTLAGFNAQLRSTLESTSRSVGHLGEGIIVGPAAAVTGLAFDRVYLLGVAEGAFPPSVTVDPFFPVGGPDPLGRRMRQRSVERRVFLSAIAAADGGRVVLSVPDSDGARKAFPSRWLLEVVGTRLGQEVDAAGFQELREEDHPWLRVVHSARDGAMRAIAPADLEDRRLCEAIRWCAADRPLAHHPMVRREDLPLERSLRMIAARRAGVLTEFDGNTAAIASQAKRIARFFQGGRPITASAIETWAACPFRFFLGYVLRVEPTHRPEEEWTIDPLQRGTLFHEVLKEFFDTLRRTSRPRPGERYTHADAALLRRIAERWFGQLEARGQVGHPLAWENARSAILADLRAFLTYDEAWRLESGTVPTELERSFGIGSGAWPALVISTNGLQARFRGYIDRIDVAPAERRAVLFDYKTGRPDSYRGLDGDPVLAGQHVQLALYARAVRQNFGADYRVGAAYWFITNRGEFKRQAIPDDPGVVDERLDAVVGAILAGIRSGGFPAVPGPVGHPGFDNCAFCDYDRICPASRDEIWERKQGDPASRYYHALAPRDRRQATEPSPSEQVP